MNDDFDTLKTAFVATADQAYADSIDKLDRLVDSLVDDMCSRTDTGSPDAPFWATSVCRLLDRLESHGGASSHPTLMAVYMAAIYRLARQKADSR